MASLATKYRPKEFDQMTEQSLIVEILENQCKDDELANRNFLLIGPAGTGKAQPMDSLILTPDGFIYMKDVTKGTEVITHEGLVASVLRVYPQGERPIYRITLMDGRSIRVSDEHLNYVIVHTSEGDIAVTLTTELVIKYIEAGMTISIPYPDISEEFKNASWYLDYLEYKKINDSVDDGSIINTVEYVDRLECQCIYIDDQTHVYISDDFIPTHNTTLARIMANKLNNNVGEPIEIDAASHSGVEGMREIIRQAQQYPIGCKYKTFIIDECFSGDTEVLTNEGFKSFESLTQKELIAQYEDDGSISFVKPTRWIQKDYDGDGYYFNPGYKACEVLMTAHHVQPIVNVLDPMKPGHTEGYIEELEFEEGDRVYTVGLPTGDKSEVTALDEVVIASMLYAAKTTNALNSLKTDCVITNGQHILSPEMYVILLSKLSQADIKYSETEDKLTGQTELFYSIPKCGNTLSDWFDLKDYDLNGIQNLLDKLADWSGACILQDIGTLVRSANEQFLKHWSDPVKHLRYFANSHHTAQFIASLCYLAGSPVQVSGTTLSYLDIELTKPSKRKHHIKDTVYCVEVPSHKIIVQASGVPFVTGNCHALSSAAWQSVLKTLEESPAKSVFFFATTNPEKIPATILSRVQTFQLSKISLDGIVKRLKYVCDAEIAEGRNITYTDDALYFLGKLANGGMRDALTTLDKALAFSSDITIENLSKSLNLPNYDDYFTLLGAYAKKDNAAITRLIDQVYNSGVNFIRWFEGFHSFVINVTKFIFLKDINVTVIPSYYQEKISTYNVKHSVICLRLANKLLSLISDLKSTQYLQEVALTYLCTPGGV